jgi:hypothetical protein
LDNRDKGEKEKCSHHLKRAKEACRRLLRFPKFKEEANKVISEIEEIEKQL